MIWGIWLLKKKVYEAAVLLWAFKRNTRKYAHIALLYFLIHWVVLEEAILPSSRLDMNPCNEQFGHVLRLLIISFSWITLNVLNGLYVRAQFPQRSLSGCSCRGSGVLKESFLVQICPGQMKWSLLGWDESCPELQLLHLTISPFITESLVWFSRLHQIPANLQMYSTSSLQTFSGVATHGSSPHLLLFLGKNLPLSFSQSSS